MRVQAGIRLPPSVLGDVPVPCRGVEASIRSIAYTNAFAIRPALPLLPARVLPHALLLAPFLFSRPQVLLRELCTHPPPLGMLMLHRGYGNVSLMRELLRHRIRSIIIVPEHPLQCHPFVGQSYLNAMPNEEEASGEDEDSGSECAQFHEEEHNTPDQHLNHDSTFDCSCAASGPLDLPRAFVIKDDPEEGPQSWWAVKTFKVRENRNDTSASRFKVSAVAVREKGN